MVKIRTKKGDLGKTDIKGARVSKNSDLIELLGDLDEVMAHFILAHNLKPNDISGFKDKVEDLVLISAIVSGYKDVKDFPKSKLDHIEKEIDDQSENYDFFIYPFDNVFKAHINILRTVVRRMERKAHYALKSEDYQVIKAYLNTLSDYVFTYMQK